MQNRTRTYKYYFLMSQLEDNDVPKIVGHSKNEETGEIYYKFHERSKVVKLRNDEKKVSPEYKYRIIKCVETYTEGPWV